VTTNIKKMRASMIFRALRGSRRATARAGRALLCALIIAVGWAGTASAHQMNLSNARIAVAPDRSVTVEVAMKGNDVDRIVGTKIFDDGSGLVRADAVAASASSIAGYMTGHAMVLGKDGTLCRPGVLGVMPDEDGVIVRVKWDCAGVEDPLVYRSTVLTDTYKEARQVVLIGTGDAQSQNLLDAARTDLSLTGDAAETGLFAVILRYVGAGMEHIFIGYDHIAFLIAIMLWARRLLPVVKIVTAFTIAHSITLSLAATQTLMIPSSIVEPAIAASIVYVALENFFSRDIDKRWRITFAFGFIHGFGFASALQEFGLPTGALVPALASFNIGVEIGQIVIVSIALPVLLVIDRLVASRGWAARGVRAPQAVYALSGVICLLGAYWFLVRTILPEPAWAQILGQ
jgi:hydrogenase/urease accessory protein HupE